MPSLPQLPEATEAAPADKLMLDQAGVSRATTVVTLHANLQPKLTLAQGALLGRVSTNPGPPEAVTLGTGLQLSQGALGVDRTVVAALPRQALPARPPHPPSLPATTAPPWPQRRLSSSVSPTR